MTVRTFGVEEELLLVRADGVPVPAGDQVVQQAARSDSGPTAGEPDPLVEHEFKQEQAEIGSPVATTTSELAAELRRLRRAAAEAAAAAGVRIAALATSPEKVRPTTTEDARYARMVEEFGLLARQQLACGQHVHVGVGSREEGVAVLDRIGPDLPAILALSGNSPFWQGQDTGYASYRTVMWQLWPSAGPTQPFGDVAGYDAAVADMVAAGSALDEAMIYFDARLSAHYPTVEIRVADVCTDVEDSVLIAVLCRAAVETAARRWRDGVPELTARVELRRAASWRAARFGIDGTLVDLATGTTRPAAHVLAALLESLAPALAEAGDLEFAREGVDRLLRGGTGAARQRATFARRRVLADVVREAAERTLR